MPVSPDLLRRARRAVAALAATAGVLAVPVLASEDGAPAAGASRADGREVIVQLAPGVEIARGRALVQRAGGRVTSRALPIVNGFAARVPADAARALAARPEVLAVTANAAVAPADATVADAEPVSAYPATVQAQEAWAAGATGRGVGVAVVDTGIAGDLPDFRVRGGSRSRVVTSVVTNPRATHAGDGFGHGTHVAGIIAGSADERPGIAPDAHLVSVKVSDDRGATTIVDVLYGLQFVAEHADDQRIRVVNLSLSSSVAESYRSDPLDAAVEFLWRMGIVVVAAAGNAGTASDAVSYAPGNDPYVITVGASDDHGTPDLADDVMSSWSSRGTTQDGVNKPDVLAPGSQIVAPLAPGSVYAAQCPDCVVDERYFQVGGSSMATGVVSGAVAAILAAKPSWTPDQVKGALVATGAVLPGASDRVVRIPAALAATSAQRVANRNLEPSRLLTAIANGEVQTSSASWRSASWRNADGSALDPAWVTASWRCDCSLLADGSVDPAMASWRQASWRRTADFAK